MLSATAFAFSKFQPQKIVYTQHQSGTTTCPILASVCSLNIYLILLISFYKGNFKVLIDIRMYVTISTQALCSKVIKLNRWNNCLSLVWFLFYEFEVDSLNIIKLLILIYFNCSNFLLFWSIHFNSFFKNLFINLIGILFINMIDKFYCEIWMNINKILSF